jgi:hypothetical protein
VSFFGGFFQSFKQGVRESLCCLSICHSIACLTLLCSEGNLMLINHPVAPSIQTAPHVPTPHARPFPAVGCAIGIELRDHGQLPAVPSILLNLRRVNPTCHLPDHWEPAETPGPLARRAIFPHGEELRWRRLRHHPVKVPIRPPKIHSRPLIFSSRSKARRR